MRLTITFILSVSFSIIQTHVAWSQKAGQECFPKQKQDSLVYDVAKILSGQEEIAMENLLQEFARSTSNQIVVVVVPDLCGMNKADFAIELLNVWGVGQAKQDNGVVVLVKPKTAEANGETFIAVGRGLSQFITAAQAHVIANNEMIPHFRENKYNDGINSGLKVIMNLAIGAYNFETYEKKTTHESKRNSWVSFIFIVIVATFFLIARGRNIGGYARRNNLGWWAAWLLLNSAAGRHRGFFNDFSGGRGGFSSRGGFGGFGGGSSGGDGAGGSW